MDLDRYRGSILGLAAGDALGAPVEFRTPGSFEPVSGMASGGAFGLKAGQWTDATSLALCLSESLIETKSFDLLDQLDRYVLWYRHGHLSSTGKCFDIGNTTSSALQEFERTRNPRGGPTSSSTAGNGSLMRLAPVPLVYSNRFVEAVEKSGESSRTTHGAIEAVDSCRYMGALITGAANGRSKKDLLGDHYSEDSSYWRENPLCEKVAAIAKGSFKEKAPPLIKGGGYVIECLEAALWAFHNSGSFESGCLLAVNLGDDADTTGAVYGQLAGAYYGASSIPDTWVNVLAKKELLESHSQALSELAASFI